MELLAGRYRLDDALGRGAAAVVYRAYDERTHTTCAVKVLRARRRRRDVWERFEREVRIMRELRHPHILRVFDYDLESEPAWMATGLCRGGSVRDHLDRRGPLGLGDVMAHGIEILSALTAAHAAGIVHRDIKPSNLLKCSSGLKVADFGVAALVDEQERPEALGSLAYMAPETRGGHADACSDLFAVGVTLFVMATNGNPFDLANDTLSSRRLKRLPRELREIVHRATRADPRDRYGSASQMARALHRSVAGASFADLVDRTAVRLGLADAESMG